MQIVFTTHLWIKEEGGEGGKENNGAKGRGGCKGNMQI